MSYFNLELLASLSFKEFFIRLKNIPFLLSRVKSSALGIWRSVSQDEFSQIYRKIRPYTMCGNPRLYGLYEAVRHVEKEKLPGDIVECGTASGGSAALMGLTLNGLKANRTLWVFDTFEGLPAPTEKDPDRDIAQNYTGSCRGEFEQVRSLFSKLGVLSNTKMVKGLFQDTFPSVEIKDIAVLHIDGDWYDSVMICLESFYDRVPIGGVIQFDDYGYWEGARKAVDDFMSRNNLDDPLVVLDFEGRQLIKTKDRESYGLSNF